MEKRYWYALSFLGIIILIVGALWLYSALSVSESGTNATETRGVFGSLFPFGTTGNSVPSVTEPRSETLGPVPKLRKISDARIAGAAFTDDGRIRYVERDTGHVYETGVDAPTSVRRTNTTIPRVHEAFFIGDAVLIRMLTDDAYENYIGYLGTTTENAALSGGFIEAYTRVAVGDELVGLLEDSVGTALFQINPATRKVTQRTTSPIRSWVPHQGGGESYLASAPSGRTTGALYRVDSGLLSKVVGDLPGLEALVSKNGDVLVSSGGVNTATLYTLLDDRLAVLPLGTLVGKCGWSNTTSVVCGIPASLPPGVYPDDWHLGRVGTDDTLWRINTEAGTAEVLMNLEEEAGVPFDIRGVQVSPDGSHVLFIEKENLTLWSAQVTPQ